MGELHSYEISLLQPHRMAFNEQNTPWCNPALANHDAPTRSRYVVQAEIGTPLSVIDGGVLKEICPYLLLSLIDC